MPRCEIPGCDNPQYAKGVCVSHYRTPRPRNYIAKPLNPQRLRVLLALKEATREDLARHIGVSRSQVQRYLQGQKVQERTAYKMADFFGVEVDYLIDSEPLTLNDIKPSP